MAYDFIQVRREGPVEYVTLNRPDVRNAFNEQVIDEITRWAAAVAADDQVRVAVLAGAGKAFCAGADLTWMSRMVSYTHDENVQDASAMAKMYASLDHLPIALVGRVHGAALGGGAGLVAVCDIVVAGEQATFGFTEVKVGIVPAVISPYVLTKVGMSATRELFLTGMRFDAARAKEIGLVHAVAQEAQLDACIGRYVSELLTAAPGAISTVKELLRKVWGRPVQDTMGITTDTIAARRVSEEGQEGMKAFLEKRKPNWTVTR
ncbi:MAG TPA: enoyl-CoA hydratase-related protein [Vicinamibacterales bacterium]